MRGRLFDPNYKPQFAGHETFPLRHLWLRKAYDAVAKSGTIVSRGIFNDPNAIVLLGVGKNMVSAIRHWGLACKVIEETKGGYIPGPVGNALFGPAQLDPYLENPASAWLAHWLIAGEGNRATTWHYVFNHVSAQAFEKSTVVSGLRETLANRPGVRVTESTLSRDVEVCLRSYITKGTANDTAEELAEPVLTQLGLITTTRGSYDFRVGPKPSLPDGIFLYALTAFWQQNASTANTLGFDLIALERGSPGITFKLDVDSVAERLVDIERISGGIYAWSDTAGMRQVIRRKEVVPDHFLPLTYLGCK
ncbi:DUF4007 family protein [Azonexus sp.]|uniref:DUF4007 family protein n=1 Tax=Azonexus sp. TaxID=1872668 RepID=UPI0027B98FF1|nr:DUF4007 family protein [Azonexus sp.]